MRHLDKLANKAFRENKPVFPLFDVSRKELTAGRHMMQRHRQIIRALGDIAPAEKDTLAFIKKEHTRCFAWGMERAGSHQKKNLPTLRASPGAIRKFGRHCGTGPKKISEKMRFLGKLQPVPLVQNGEAQFLGFFAL